MFLQTLFICFITLFSTTALAEITLNAVQDMNFGDVLPIGVPATIVVRADGSYSDPQGVVIKSNRINPATFQLTSSQKNVTVYLSTPTSFTLSNGIDTLTVSHITDSSNGIYHFVGKQKKQKLHIGGTMNIPGGYISGGSYTGTLTVVVDY